ncbi:MAG TPA: hypothetical protein VE959_20095 [Bryobacteraceae bacterium]|nr:hypothetical protein [Bryobacteraceae bacterium]
MATDYVIVLLKNLSERKRVAGLRKAEKEAMKARRYLAGLATSKREVSEFEEWGKRNCASIAAALEAFECDEWN